MNFLEGATHQDPDQDPSVLSSSTMSGDMRKHVLAGLAIARRSLANAHDDAAMGVKIDPAIIAELERVVNEYVRMLDETNRARAGRCA